jgi:aminoglycoside 2''-phosphotransferase
MATIPDAYLRRIRADLPDTDPQHVDLITDGMVNDVIVVDRRWVYRFAKHDWSKPLMRHEAKVLDLVRAHVDVPVPHLELLGDDCCRYPFLVGTPLTRRTLLGWTAADRAAVLKSVVRFIAHVHAIPTEEATAAGIGPSDTNRDASWWRTFYADLTTTLFPHLMRHQRDYVDDLFAPVLDGTLTFEHRPVLVYGDVASYHLLVEPSERRLAAVLDFGTAGIGDPAVDVAALLHVFGESLVAPHFHEHSALDEATLRRARFWCATLDLQLALLGLRHNDLSLLVAHVGAAARDDAVGVAGRRRI